MTMHGVKMALCRYDFDKLMFYMHAGYLSVFEPLDFRLSSVFRLHAFLTSLAKDGTNEIDVRDVIFFVYFQYMYLNSRSILFYLVDV